MSPESITSGLPKEFSSLAESVNLKAELAKKIPAMAKDKEQAKKLTAFGRLLARLKVIETLESAKNVGWAIAGYFYSIIFYLFVTFTTTIKSGVGAIIRRAHPA